MVCDANQLERQSHATQRPPGRRPGSRICEGYSWCRRASCSSSALANSNVGPLRHDWAFLLGLGIAGLACLPIARFYREHYGRMSPSARQQAREAMAFAAAPAVMFGGALLLRSRAEWSLDLPVNAIAVAFAGVMFISYAAGAGIRAHHVAIWGGLLIAGACRCGTAPTPATPAS